MHGLVDLQCQFSGFAANRESFRDDGNLLEVPSVVVERVERYGGAKGVVSVYAEGTVKVVYQFEKPDWEAVLPDPDAELGGGLGETNKFP